MTQSWDLILIILFMAAVLGLSMLLKLNFRLFQKHLMPTAMMAGFIGLGILIIGHYLLNIINKEELLKIQSTLGEIVYHLMAVGFIALALKDRRSKRNKDIVNTGFFIVNTYMVQGIMGFLISLFLAKYFFTNIFPCFGLFLPLGFTQGPGNALSIGQQWERIMQPGTSVQAIPYAGNIGLSIATIGFLWALLGGVPFLNFLVKRKYSDTKIYKISEVKEVEIDKELEHTSTVPKTIHIDNLSIQLLLIGSIYLITYLMTRGIEGLLINMGSFGETVANMMWGFHFMLGTVIALVVRKFLDTARDKGIIKINFADNYLLQRISTASFDFMITASISAISFYALKEYMIPVLILTTIGGLFTMVYVYFMCNWVYKEDVVEHIIALYGMWTGTITTGIALLKEIDPYSKTDVPEHLVLGSGFAIFIGFPLMVILAIPIEGFKQNKPELYIITLVILIAFSIAMNVCMYLNRYKKNVS